MGILAALISAFAVTARDIVSKFLASRVHPDTSTFASFAFALLFYAVLMVAAYIAGWETFEVSSHFLTLVLLRSLSDVVAEGAKMRAFAFGDVSLVTCFLALSPLFLAVASPLITGDPVSRAELLGISLLALGSVLLVRRDRTTGEVIQLKAILYAVLAAAGLAVNSCFDRLAVLSGGPILAGFAMTLLAGVFTAPTLVRDRRAMPDLAAHAKGFLVRGGLETLFMVSKLFALQFLSAHVVGGISRLSIMLAVVAGRVWFKEQDIERRLFAAVLTYAGIIILLVSAATR
jgi:drug/metabolite transporter (DMT)-like permease